MLLLKLTRAKLRDILDHYKRADCYTAAFAQRRGCQCRFDGRAAAIIAEVNADTRAAD